jgi:hypothetical protein
MPDYKGTKALPGTLGAKIAAGDRASKRRKENNARVEASYSEWVKNNPEVKLGLDVAPVAGQLMSVRDAIHHANMGKNAAAISDMVGAIPGVKLAKSAPKIIGTILKTASAYDRGGDMADYIKSKEKNKKAQGGLMKKAAGGAAKVRKGMASPEGKVIDAMRKIHGK